MKMSLMLFLAMIAAVVLSFFIPVLFWGRFGFRTKGFVATVVIGAGTYVVYLLVVRTIIAAVTASLSPVASAFVSALGYAGGMTALDIAAYRLFRVVSDDMRCTFAVGVGQALVESAVIVGMAFINDIFFSILIMNGTFESHMMETGMALDQIVALENALVNMPASSLFLSAFERMLFSAALVFASVFLGRYFETGRKAKALAFAFVPLFVAYLVPALLGTVSDPSFVYVSMSLMAVLSVAMVWFLGRRQP